jgi:hypothetical protein
MPLSNFLLCGRIAQAFVTAQLFARRAQPEPIILAVDFVLSTPRAALQAKKIRRKSRRIIEAFFFPKEIKL